MTIAIVVVVMLAVGVDIRVALVVLVAMVSPVAGIVGAIGMGAWVVGRGLVGRRRRTSAAGSSFLTSLASATAAGSTVRQALIDGDERVISDETRRRCAVGRPMAEVARTVHGSIPGMGREVAAVLELSEDTGAMIAPTLRDLAEHARDREQLRRDQRVAVAQARLSAWVVGVIPLAVALALTAVRGIPEPGGAVILVPMVIGGTMMALGAATVFVLSNRASA
ncbi:MAG: type II secretion system F family protein [Acidimicrobiia bacterium]|nr:type II secretion system F family protein [Acidimicrobiia bacterium]